MVLSHMVPQFSAIGSGGVPPMPPTILMSDTHYSIYKNLSNWLISVS
jgi:hypothetical protein